LQQRSFTEGSVPSHLIRLTGYMTLGMVSVMTASLVEAVYVGMVGTLELAALSFTFPLVMILQGVSMGVSVGASSVVARAMGAGERERGRLLTTHASMLVMILVVILGTAAWFALESFFSLLGAEPDVLAATVSYMQIWLLGLPCFAFAFVGSTLMRAAGDAVTPGYLMTVGSGLHVLIAPFFIFGLAGAPEMGLDGAAVGFVIARIISFVAYAYCFVIRDRLVVARLQGMWQSCLEILHVGLPAVASNLIAPVSMTVITRLLAAHGAPVVAGFGVASRVEAMIMMIIFAMTMSVAPFVGQNWEAGHLGRVKTALSLCNRFSMGWGLFAFTIMLIGAEPIAALLNEDPEVVAVATGYLTIIPLSIGFIGVTQTATQSFNALGKPMPPLLISILQMLVIYIPLALIGDYLWGYVGIFVALVATSALVAALGFVWINYTVKRGINKGHV